MIAGPSHLRLEVISGNAAGETILVEEELVIGRHASGNGRLSDDEEISRQHARISREVTGDYAIEDLGSSNGTFVNGLRIQSSRLLSLGDSIETGATTLVVREIARPEPAAATPPAGDMPAPDATDVAAASASSARTSTRSTVIPPPTASPPPTDPSPEREQAAGPTPPLGLKLDVDFDAREARITLGGGADTVRMVLEDGDWRAVSTGPDAED